MGFEDGNTPKISTPRSLSAGKWDHVGVQALVLGTAQWGNPYGVTNRHGRLSDEAIAEIIDVAREADIQAVDTASRYGDAESRLHPWARQFTVTTKVRGSGAQPIAQQLAASLASLGVERVHACLLHDWPTLTQREAAGAVRQLRALQDAQLVTAVGVSAYDDDELGRALAAFGTVDVVQVPVNALDQRLTRSRALQLIAEQGAEIQARSVFLQGLLAGRSDTDLGRHPDVVGFHDYCAQQGQGPIEVALGFVKGVPWVSRVVVGVTGVDEFKGILKAWDSAVEIRPEVLGSSDLTLLDPRRWA